MSEPTRQQKAQRIYDFEERAAIIEHVGGFHRQDAEDMAERQQGGRPVWGGSIVGVIDAGAVTE